MKSIIKAISMFLSTIILITSLSGCSWWNTNSTAVEGALDKVGACLVGELVAGAVSDPMLLVSGCVGATLSALSALLQSIIAAALPPTDAGVAAQLSPGILRLVQIQAHTNALIAAGVK
jgi:hypothetical protein